MATFVMALAIATSVTTLNSGFQMIDTARNTTIAAQLMQSVMEDLRLLPWDASNPGASSITALQATNNGVAGNVTLDSSFTAGDAVAAAMVARFTITRTINDVSGQIGMKEIILNVQWTGIDGRTHTLSYSGYYAQDGIHDFYIN